MTVFLCVDKKMGVAFNNRRQSQDRAVIEKIVEMSSGGPLYVSQYSSPLFDDLDADLHIVDNPQDIVSSGQEEGSCFIEAVPITCKPERLVLFGWGVVYPQDTKCTIDFNEYDIVSMDEISSEIHEHISVLTLVRRYGSKKNRKRNNH